MKGSTQLRAKLLLPACVCLMVSIVALTATPTAHADESGASVDTVKDAQARQLLEQESRVLATQDYANAAHLLEQAYRLAPLAEVYFHQGRMFRLQGRTLDAADCYQRYLDAVGGKTDTPLSSESRGFLADFHQPMTEISVSGDSGSLLFADGRLIGGLPLPGPLRVAAGLHRFRLDKGGRPYDSDELTIPANQRGELRITPGSRQTAITVLTIAPAILLLLDLEQIPDGVQEQIWQRVSAAAREERSLLLTKQRTQELLSARSDGATCRQSLDCQEALAKQADAALVLALSVKGGSGYQLGAQLFDALPSAIGATKENHCSSCDVRQLLRLVADLTHRILRSNAERQRGTLSITSVPSGATVSVDGRALGSTPFQREAFIGARDVVVLQPGLAPYHQTVTIEVGQVAQVAVKLEAGSSSSSGALTPPRRPRWRFIVGGAVVATGLVFVGFGASALGAQGSCINDPMAPALVCDYIHNTAAVGGTFVGLGVALIAGGVVTVAWPPKRSKAPEK